MAGTIAAATIASAATLRRPLSRRIRLFLLFLGRGSLLRQSENVVALSLRLPRSRCAWLAVGVQKEGDVFASAYLINRWKAFGIRLHLLFPKNLSVVLVEGAEGRVAQRAH